MNIYNPIEPTVIDDDILKKSTYEQAHGDAAEISRKEGIDPLDVLQLRLDFKNILKIDNLWSFESLTKLQLDNNIIEKIENLSFLKNLTWLDLSFNNISQIEGLDALTKLTDLSLFNNRISRLENMDHLVNLNVLSVGNNNISELENLSYLRKFENLRILNVSGNPFCTNNEYKHYVLAHMKDLKYLDYRLADAEEVKSARAKYMDELIALEEEEKIQNSKQQDTKSYDDRNKLYQKAHLDNIDELFHDMFENDADFKKFLPLAETRILEIQESYKSKFDPVLQEMKGSLLKQQSLKDEEIKQFASCLKNAKRENDQVAIKLLNDLNHKKKGFIKVIQNSREPREVEDAVTALKKSIDDVSDFLMRQEMNLVEQVEDIIKEFERNYNELCTGTMEISQSNFSRLREAENEYHEKVTEAVMSTFDKLAKGDTEELSDVLRDLIGDKDGVVNSLTASHEFHMSKYDAQEDILVQGVAKDLEQQVQKMHEQELKRNRARVLEIIRFVEKNLQEIDLAEEV